MADNKKYYYLKLKENFFDTDELLLLESMPDGVQYSNILLKLYLRSLKNGGKLMFKNMIPYTPETLATIVRQPVAVMEKALLLFRDLGLIEILDSGAIYMMDIQNFIGKSSTEADRQRKYYQKIGSEKQTHLPSFQKSCKNSTPELELEKEKEKELELESEPPLTVYSADLSKCIQCYENNIGTLSKAVADNILYEIENGTSAGLICSAIEEAVLKNVRNWRYVQAILNRCKQEGIKNKSDFEQQKKKGDVSSNDTHANLATMQPTGTVVL